MSAIYAGLLNMPKCYVVDVEISLRRKELK